MIVSVATALHIGPVGIRFHPFQIHSYPILILASLESLIISAGCISKAWIVVPRQIKAR